MEHPDSDAEMERPGKDRGEDRILPEDLLKLMNANLEKESPRNIETENRGEFLDVFEEVVTCAWESNSFLECQTAEQVFEMLKAAYTSRKKKV
jgi:hypothetical protein